MRIHRRLLYLCLVALLAVPAAAVACVNAFDAESHGADQTDAYVESETSSAGREGTDMLRSSSGDAPCSSDSAKDVADDDAAYVQSSDPPCADARGVVPSPSTCSRSTTDALGGDPTDDQTDTVREGSTVTTSDPDDADSSSDDEDSDDKRDSVARASDSETPCARAQVLRAASSQPYDAGGRAAAIDLTNWKLQLPEGEPERPTEIAQPELDRYQSKWFQREGTGALRFRAPVNGVTTSGSKNPRSELREMAPGGEKAAWSTSEGAHTMAIDQAITELPEGKPQIVAGQIHGTSDDLTVFRLEGTKLYVTNGDDSHYKLVDPNYKLGTRFQAAFVAGGGELKAYYNGQLQTTIKVASDTAYFKAGAYTQANCENVERCEESNAGEVVIYGLTVTGGAQGAASTQRSEEDDS